jgi:hypothetical protein
MRLRPTITEVPSSRQIGGSVRTHRDRAPITLSKKGAGIRLFMIEGVVGA